MALKRRAAGNRKGLSAGNAALISEKEAKARLLPQTPAEDRPVVQLALPTQPLAAPVPAGRIDVPPTGSARTAEPPRAVRQVPARPRSWPQLVTTEVWVRLFVYTVAALLLAFAFLRPFGSD